MKKKIEDENGQQGRDGQNGQKREGMEERKEKKGREELVKVRHVIREEKNCDWKEILRVFIRKMNINKRIGIGKCDPMRGVIGIRNSAKKE